MGQGLSNTQNVSPSTLGNGIVNDQPDWAPGQPSTGGPEVPLPMMLPGAALLLGGLALLYQRRRRFSGRHAVTGTARGDGAALAG